VSERERAPRAKGIQHPAEVRFASEPQHTLSFACIVDPRDDGLDALIREGALHDRSISHRTDDVGISSGRDIEADHDMTCRPEARCEEPAEPARRAGEKNAHYPH